jgi:hypothetical protein
MSPDSATAANIKTHALIFCRTMKKVTDSTKNISWSRKASEEIY